MQNEWRHIITVQAKFFILLCLRRSIIITAHPLKNILPTFIRLNSYQPFLLVVYKNSSESL